MIETETITKEQQLVEITDSIMRMEKYRLRAVREYNEMLEERQSLGDDIKDKKQELEKTDRLLKEAMTKRETLFA